MGISILKHIDRRGGDDETSPHQHSPFPSTLHLDVCSLACVSLSHHCEPRFTHVDPTVPRDKRVVTTIRSP
jgi:hypothetical protein